VSVYERLEALNIALLKLTPPLRPARPGRRHSRPCRKIRHRFHPRGKIRHQSRLIVRAPEPKGRAKRRGAEDAEKSKEGRGSSRSARMLNETTFKSSAAP
jgi:hypothetical protein